MKDMRTNKDLKHSTRGGLTFTTPKGSKVYPVPFHLMYGRKPGTFWVEPSTYDAATIEHHDAVHYGIAVDAEDVDIG